MPNLPNTGWFALAVQRYRHDLGYRHTEMAALGGPSRPTIIKIESGQGNIAPAALTRLERALSWEPGSAARALGPNVRSLQDVFDAIGYTNLHPSTPHNAEQSRSSILDDRSTDSCSASVTAKRPQPRAIRTRAAIVAAAAHEFTSRGYVAASLDTILDRAGCTKGAMYFHFSCKADLAAGVLSDGSHLYIAITARWRTADSAHPLDAIACLVNDIADAYTSHTLLRAEKYLALEPAFRTQRPSQVWESALQELAEKAAQADCLREGCSANQLARALIVAISGHLYMAHADSGTAKTPALTTQLTDAVEVVFAAMATSQYLVPTSSVISPV